MKICMLVYNNATKDNRVMREANSLQKAGHQVTVVGIPDADVKAPVEILENGVKVYRVMWQGAAYARFLRAAIFRIVPALLLIGLLLWGLVALAVRAPEAVSAVTFDSIGAGIDGITWAGAVGTLLQLILGAAVLAVLWKLGSGYLGALGSANRMKAGERDMMLRYAELLFNGESLDPREFPRPQSRIPNWLPDVFIEFILEPLDWFSGRSGRFVLYRYRAAEMVALAVRLKPDVVHAHDCLALPTGMQVKTALNIPLVYDAHEIYEATATKKIGVNDYYMRIHKRLLGQVDGFITVNQSIAAFYSFAYPEAVKPLVLRNAVTQTPPFEYDGRLHDRAGLPRDQKILLYQGGYTAERGLPILVQSARDLPEGWTLVMMGWGPLAAELRRLATHNQKRMFSFGRQRREWLARGSLTAPPPPRVVFVPGVKHKELPFWTAGATVGIVPYENKVLNHWFCSPNKVWEFPNAGVPLIVQPFPELRKVVEAYECGWILPDDFTPATIADLIASLDDDMIAEAKLGCARFIDADHWEAAYERKLIALYQGIERGRQIPARTGPAAKQAPARKTKELASAEAAS